MKQPVAPFFLQKEQPMHTNEYRLSERSMLRPGTVFRAGNGPLFQLSDGSTMPVAAKGPFVFQAAEINGERVYIHAFDRNGQHSVLHISGERESPSPEIIPRPYEIRGTIRKVKRCSTRRRAESVKASHAKAKGSKQNRKLKGGGTGSATSRHKPKQQRLFKPSEN